MQFIHTLGCPVVLVCSGVSRFKPLIEGKEKCPMDVCGEHAGVCVCLLVKVHQHDQLMVCN